MTHGVTTNTTVRSTHQEIELIEIAMDQSIGSETANNLHQFVKDRARVAQYLHADGHETANALQRQPSCHYTRSTARVLYALLLATWRLSWIELSW
jgi:hypothetical protein